MIGEEFKMMHPGVFHSDPHIKHSVREGFTQFKSDSADYVIENNMHYPLTIVLFYDSDIYLDSIMKSLAIKTLDVFLYKYENKFAQGIYENMTPKNSNYAQINVDEKHRQFDFTDNPGTTFESALPIIFEDVSPTIKLIYNNVN